MQILKIPQYFRLKDIQSVFLEKALKEPDLLGYLREVYEKDSNVFYKLRDEMLLRGFEFATELRSNRFPALIFEPKSIILVKNEQQLLKKIPKGILGIEVLITRYEAESDYFFNYISIEALAHFLKKDETFLRYQLEQVGFEIIAVEDLIKLQASNEANKSEIEVVVTTSVQKKEVDEVVFDQQSNKRILPHTLDTTPLNQIFLGTKFNSFHQYCQNQKVEKFSDIDIDLIEKFQYTRGVGITKYNLVKETYLKFLEKYPLEYETEETKKSTSKVNLFEFFQKNALRCLLERNGQSYLAFIDNLYVNNPNENLEKRLKKYQHEIADLINQENRKEILKAAKVVIDKITCHSNYCFFEDFKWAHCMKILKLDYLKLSSEGYFYEVLYDDEFAPYLDIIYSNLDKYDPFNLQLKEFISKMTYRTLNILALRVNHTLEAVGLEIGVTRERVRQIERKAAVKLKDFFQSIHLDMIVQHFLEKNFRLQFEELLDHLKVDSQHALYVEYYFQHNPKFSIVDGIVVDKELWLFIEEKIKEMPFIHQEIISFEETVASLNQEINYEFSIALVELIMEKQGFIRKKDIYIKNNVKLSSLIKHLFQYKIDGAIEMTNENFEKVQQLMLDTFGRKFENGLRAATARIRDTQNVILVDGNTFMYYDLDIISQQLLNKISAALEEVLTEWESVNARVIYDCYKETWQQYNINTHYHLYSIISYYFSDDYVIGRGNTLSIQRLGTERRDLASTLTIYLEKQGGQATKKQIIEQLHWKDYTLEQIIAKNKEFFTVEMGEGLGVKLFSSIGFTTNELQKIQMYVERYMDGKDYLFPNDLMIEMEFEDELSELLVRRNILKLYDFSSLLKYLNDELRGFPQFLFKRNSLYDQMEKAVKEEFPLFLIRNEYEQYFLDKGYALSGLAGSIAILVDQQFFYPYTTSKYINAKHVTVDEIILKELEVYIERTLEGKDYVSILDLTGYTNLPSIGDYEWTPHLVAHFATKIGYQILNTTRDYRYNKLLLISKHLGGISFDQLVYKVLTDEYEGNYHERHVGEFLMQKRLTHSPKISNEIRISELFEFTELGFIKLKGE